MDTACAYIRVSTDDQTEYSPDAQLNAIKKYAKDNNLILPQKYIFMDEGYSGRKAEKRPGFMNMIATAKSKPTPFSTILVHKFDRFARNREDSVVYKSLLKKECNIKVISITESIEDDKFSIILESMLEAMAEYYSLNLSEEVKKGMAEKAKRGEYQAYAPFGYENDKINKTLKIQEKEAEIVKYIFDEFLKDVPIQQITKNLSNMSIYTKRGNKFERRNIEYILKNTVYMGYTTWCEEGKRERDYKKNSHIVKGNYPPIVSKKIFDTVQQKIDVYKTKYKPKQRPSTEFKHYLSGIVKCSYCGSNLSISGKYTQCIGYSHGKCNVSNAICIADLENLFFREVDIMLNKSKIDPHIKIKNKISQIEENKLIQLEIKKLNSRLDKAKSAYLDGIDSLDEYKQNKLSIEVKLKSLNYSLQKNKTDTEFDIKKLQKDLYNLKNIILQKDISNFEKINCVKNCIEKIVFNKAEKTLEFYYSL